ncbi:MAG: hypothetical protein ACRDJ4_14180 [Actinomycetota bacterium]
MRIEAACGNCGRRFLLTQILPEPEGTSGRCPFCGIRFGRHYLAMLPEAIEAGEEAADTFIASIKRLLETNPGFTVDVAGLLARLRDEMSGEGERTSA